jgi:hypothetical protein
MVFNVVYFIAELFIINKKIKNKNIRNYLKFCVPILFPPLPRC